MGRRFCALVVVLRLGRLLLGCQQIVLALERIRLVLYFAGIGPFLCPLGQGSCSNCKVHLRSCIVGFLPG